MTIELKTAKYKGVEFEFEEMPTTGGNRLIKFNFPGSDKQAVERQGRTPRVYNMTIVIPNDGYYDKRDSILRVLEDGERGVLTHPTFGDIENVINGSYSLDERTGALGRGVIKVTFEVDDQAGIPVEAGNLPSQVNQKLSEYLTQIGADMVVEYSVSTNLSGNFSDAIEDAARVPDFFTQAAEFGEPLAENISAFRTRITDFSAQVGNLIQAPAELSSEISGLFEDLQQLYDTPETLFGAFQLITSYGEGDETVPPNTVARVERQKNRDVLRTNMRGQALGYSYLNASLSTYATTNDLETVLSTMESQYLDMRDNQDLTEESQELIDQLRVQALKTLDAVRVNTRTIITINTAKIPLTVLTYSLYGSTELATTIADLNNIKTNAFVEGDLEVLTA